MINSYKKNTNLMTYGIRALYRLPSHPLLFTLKSLSSSVKAKIGSVKKSKVVYFFAEIKKKKKKNMLPSILQMPTAVCFYYFFFLQKIYHF